MHLPLHTRAFSLLAALSTTAAIIVTIAEIGHPPSDGYGLIATLVLPEQPQPAAVARVTDETRAGLQTVSAEMPQP